MLKVVTESADDIERIRKGGSVSDEKGTISSVALPEGLSHLLGRILDQLSVTSWLPSGFLVASVATAAALSSDPSDPGSTLIDFVMSLELVSLIALTGAVVLVTTVTQAFQFEAIRMLEGYWGSGPITGWISSRSQAYYRRRHARLHRLHVRLRVKAVQSYLAAVPSPTPPDGSQTPPASPPPASPTTPEPTTREHLETWVAAAATHFQEQRAARPKLRSLMPIRLTTPERVRLRDYPQLRRAYRERRYEIKGVDQAADVAYKRSWMRKADHRIIHRLDEVKAEIDRMPVQIHRVMPTRLGNVLRAYEERLSRETRELQRFVQVRADSVPALLLKEHDQARGRLDVYCTLCLVSLVCALVAPLLTYRDDDSAIVWWSGALWFATFVGGSLVSYRAAVASAHIYGATLQSVDEVTPTPALVP